MQLIPLENKQSSVRGAAYGCLMFLTNFLQKTNTKPITDYLLRPSPVYLGKSCRNRKIRKQQQEWDSDSDNSEGATTRNQAHESSRQTEAEEGDNKTSPHNITHSNITYTIRQNLKYNYHRKQTDKKTKRKKQQ
eukprot:12781196-Ditylum_brightwellii.AAC.1